MFNYFEIFPVYKKIKLLKNWVSTLSVKNSISVELTTQDALNIFNISKRFS